MLEKQIIEELNKFLKNYLNLRFEPLDSKQLGIFRLQGTSQAINFRGDYPEEIKVIHWFADFYIYIEIRFLQNYTHKLISTSIFHGQENDSRKNQLFRAEWDDYYKDSESRPQPHWHITRDNAIYDRFSDFTNHKDEKEKIGFENYDVVQAEVFDTKKIHFAMSGNWQNQISPVHKIEDASKVVAWLEGLLEHIKYELNN
ncbi:MAG: hypothetical protein IPM42_05360 [Saprospiraceae bacterium]|nr:hypothetical protein [Saprospiraceae bacterium]